MADPLTKHQFTTSVCQFCHFRLFVSVLDIQAKTSQPWNLHPLFQKRSLVTLSDFIVILWFCCLGSNRKNEDCKAMMLLRFSRISSNAFALDQFWTGETFFLFLKRDVYFSFEIQLTSCLASSSSWNLHPRQKRKKYWQTILLLRASQG